jgi:hypothetical protein
MASSAPYDNKAATTNAPAIGVRIRRRRLPPSIKPTLGNWTCQSFSRYDRATPPPQQEQQQQMMDQTSALKVHYSFSASTEEAASSLAMPTADQVIAVLEALAADSSSGGGGKPTIKDLASTLWSCARWSINWTCGKGGHTVYLPRRAIDCGRDDGPDQCTQSALFAFHVDGR